VILCGGTSPERRGGCGIETQAEKPWTNKGERAIPMEAARIM